MNPSTPFRPVEDRLFVSTVACPGPRELPGVLARLHGLGIANVELSAPHPWMAAAELAAVLGGWRRRGLRFLIHNYFPRPAADFVLNLASAEPAVQRATDALIAEALDLGAAIDAPLYGVHAGYLADAHADPGGRFVFDGTTAGSPADSLARVAARVRRVLEAAGDRLGADGLLLENLFPDSPGQPVDSHSLACTPADLDRLFGAVADPRVGLLLDLAHFHITCTQRRIDADAALESVVRDHGHRLRAIHMSGNDGVRDLHRPLDPGSWPLRALHRLRNLPGRSGRGLWITLESRRLDDDILLRQRDLLLETAV